MKQIILPLIALYIVACNDKKPTGHNKSKTIDAKQLVLIIQDSSFTRFRELVSIIGYPIIDSNAYDGKIIYNAEEAGEGEEGDILTATMTKNFHIDYLHFSTYSKELFGELKQQFIELGFKSLDNSDNIEEFENNNIYISTTATKKSYHVILVRKE